MMKLNLFILVFCLFSLSILAQKKEVYLNDDLVQISQFEFNKINDAHTFYNWQYETDSAIVNLKVQRIKKGKISKELLKTIKSELSGFSGKEIPENDLIIINCYHGMDDCNSSGNHSYVRAKYKKFLKSIGKMTGISQ